MTRPQRPVKLVDPDNPYDLRWLSDEAIEAEAELLLATYETKHGPITDLVVPIEDIAEVHFKLVIEHRDLQAELESPSVFGAIDFLDRKICVDFRLDTSLNPRMDGRCRFTLAHEIAHWHLHRDAWFKRHGGERLPGWEEQPRLVCRDGAKGRHEWQANAFAAPLLMRRRQVLAVWCSTYGHDPIALAAQRQRETDIVDAEMAVRAVYPPSREALDDLLLENAARPLAEQFRVSPQAMRRRLESIGLLTRSTEARLL